MHLRLLVFLCLVALATAWLSRKTTKRPTTTRRPTTTTRRPTTTRRHKHTTKKPNSILFFSKYTRPKDCHDHWLINRKQVDGVFPIYPDGKTPVKVFCEFTSTGAYTLIQRRINGAVSFYRKLRDYQVGFGTSQGDYWIGLDNIHKLTTAGNTKLRINLQDWHGNTRFAQYGHFLVLDHTQKYRVYISQFSGSIADDFSYHNGAYFTTFDYPDPHNCSINMRAGWWYNYCAYSLLNGKYYIGGYYQPSRGFYDGLFWKDWFGPNQSYNYALKFVSMGVYH